MVYIFLSEFGLKPCKFALYPMEKRKVFLKLKLIVSILIGEN